LLDNEPDVKPSGPIDPVSITKYRDSVVLELARRGRSTTTLLWCQLLWCQLCSARSAMVPGDFLGDLPEHRFLVAISERGYLMGGLFYELEPDAHIAHMDKIVVVERFRRKGVAAALLEELCNRLRTAGFRSLTTGLVLLPPRFCGRAALRGPGEVA